MPPHGGRLVSAHWRVPACAPPHQVYGPGHNWNFGPGYGFRKFPVSSQLAAYRGDNSLNCFSLASG
jgi:hypothetical protein